MELRTEETTWRLRARDLIALSLRMYQGCMGGGRRDSVVINE